MGTKNCNKILKLSTAVRTNVLQSVKEKLKKVPPDFDSVLPYSTNIVDWLKPIIDLSDFHVYPTNGITEGLNWWMAHENRNIFMDEGDYQWVKEVRNDSDQYIKYISVPSAIDGNFKNIPYNVSVALDLAYVGSTESRKINIGKNVEYVFYSLSKPFGIRNVRTGWIFTRNQDKRLEALIHNAKYYNYYAHSVAETVIQNFKVDYIFTELREKQLEICNELTLTPSDSVWIATSDDAKYNKFKRGNINRLCLAPCY